MKLVRREARATRRLGILPGTFHPPTRAHVHLAYAALAEVDDVLFVLPRRFPHKEYEKVGFDERVRLIEKIVENEPRFSVGVSEGGLFIEIAGEARALYGPETQLVFICGRDAAQRIVSWDYGEPDAFEKMLGQFEMLVAPRRGPYEAPERFRSRIRPLWVSPDYDEVSATEVRRRIQARQPWEPLVPPEIVEDVRRLYEPAN